MEGWHSQSPQTINKMTIHQSMIFMNVFVISIKMNVQKIHTYAWLYTSALLIDTAMACHCIWHLKGFYHLVICNHFLYRYCWPISVPQRCLSFHFSILQRKMQKSRTGIFSVTLNLYPGKYEVGDFSPLGYDFLGPVLLD